MTGQAASSGERYVVTSGGKRDDATSDTKGNKEATSRKECSLLLIPFLFILVQGFQTPCIDDVLGSEFCQSISSGIEA